MNRTNQTIAAEPHERLKQARLKRGYTTAREAAIAFGWNINTYSSHENGNRPLSRQAAERYARPIGVSAGWLLYGEKAAAKTETTAVRMGGVIGAGQEVWPDGDYEEIESTLAEGAVEAFRVKGDSMLPVAREGDV